MTTPGNDQEVYQTLQGDEDGLSPQNSGSKKRKFVVVASIIGTEFGERLAYYGLAGSLTLFLRRLLNQSAANASVIVQIWIAFLYITPIIGGYVADSKLGRFRTILYFALFYFMGLIGVSICSIIFELSDANNVLIDIIFYLSLVVIGTGTGGVKSCVAPFGAQQVVAYSSLQNNNNNNNNGVSANDSFNKEMLEQAAKDEQTSFFNWFYFGINLGALISYTLVSYLCQNVNFSVGYAIPTVALLLAIIAYILPMKYYFHTRPNNSALALFFGIVKNAFKNRKNFSKYSSSKNDNDSYNNPLNIHNSDDTIELTSLSQGGSKKHDNNNDDDNDNDNENGDNVNVNNHKTSMVATHWLEMAKEQFGGSYNETHYKFIDDSRYIFNLLGFMFFFIFYFCVYNQQASVFYNQGCQMNYYINGWEFPISSISLADVLIILILVPIMDRIIYPCFEKRLNIGFPLLQRIGTGFFFATCAMVMAAFVEVLRKHSKLTDIKSTCDDSLYIHDISIFWQMPQYVLVGASEVLASVAGLEFFYDQAPESVKTIIYSLYLVTTGLGSLVGTFIILIVNNTWKAKWIENDLDDGYLEYYFILLAIIMALSLCGHILYAEKYTYKLDDTMGNSVDSFRKYSQSDRGRPRTCCKILCWR